MSKLLHTYTGDDVRGNQPTKLTSMSPGDALSMGELSGFKVEKLAANHSECCAYRMTSSFNCTLKDQLCRFHKNSRHQTKLPRPYFSSCSQKLRLSHSFLISVWYLYILLNFLYRICMTYLTLDIKQSLTNQYMIVNFYLSQ